MDLNCIDAPGNEERIGEVVAGEEDLVQENERDRCDKVEGDNHSNLDPAERKRAWRAHGAHLLPQYIGLALRCLSLCLVCLCAVRHRYSGA